MEAKAKECCLHVLTEYGLAFSCAMMRTCTIIQAFGLLVPMQWFNVPHQI